MRTSHDAESAAVRGAAHSRHASGRLGSNQGAVVIVLRATCQRDPDMLDHLARCGQRACVVPDAAQALAVVRALVPAVVLLDLRDGEASGLAAWAQLKRIPQVHLIAIAAELQPAAFQRGLDASAHVVVADHASAREIAARIREVVRRGASARAPEGSGLLLDEHRYSATLDGRPLDLTPAEFRLLALLLAAGPRVVSREQVLDSMGTRDVASERSVDSLVHHLRRKLAAVRPGEKIVRATYGAGYRLHLVTAPPTRNGSRGAAP